MSNGGMQQGAIPAGWYPDPAGSGQMRWWDGGAWSEHVAPGAGSAASGERPQLDAKVPVYTWAIWLVVLLPLVSLVLPASYHPHFRFIRIDGALTIDPRGLYTPGYFISAGLNLVSYVLMIVFSYLDEQILKRRGVVRPFPWGWTFLFSVIYIIGRSVIVHRVAPKRGLAPIWVMIAVFVVVWISIGAWEATVFSHLHLSQ